jgi:hypothetical protein
LIIAIDNNIAAPTKQCCSENTRRHKKCSAVQCSAVQFSTGQYSILHSSSVQYRIVLCTTIHYSAYQYSAVLYSAVQCPTISSISIKNAYYKSCTVPPCSILHPLQHFVSSSLQLPDLYPPCSRRYRQQVRVDPVHIYTLFRTPATLAQPKN